MLHQQRPHRFVLRAARVAGHTTRSVPDAISDEVAAAVMVKGCTVEYLVRRTYAVQPGDNVLLTAAAGGVGLIACQWLRALGANVIGTVGTAEKGEIARANGCDHVILYRDENIPEKVREITDGEMCAVAYDSVGASTFEPRFSRWHLGG